MTDHAPPPPLEEQQADHGSSLFRRPPGAVIAGIAVALGLLVLWLLSYPGGSIEVAALATLALGVLAVVWLVRTITYLRARGQGRSEGKPAVLVVAPIVLVVVTVLAVAAVPAKARFSLAKDDFADLVAEAPPATDPAAEPVPFDVPDRVGTFDVDKAYRKGDAVVFFVPGGFFSNVGFAYLPSGPFDELETGDLENPSFSKLTGDWYSFSTST